MKRSLLFASIFGLSLLAGCSESPESLMSSARDYMAQQDYAAATIQLRNALREIPENAEARYLLGVALIERRDYAAAEKELRRALEYGHGEQEVLPPLARAMVEGGKGRQLIDEFGGRKLEEPLAQAKLQTALGDAHVMRGQLKEAKRAYDAALIAQANYFPARVGQARLIAASGDLPAARRMAEALVAEAPKSGEALMLRGELLSVEGKHAEAQQAFVQVLELQPRNYNARRALVASLISAKQYDKAAQEIAAARETEGGTDAGMQYLQASMNLQQKNYRQAIEDVQHVLKVAPEHAPSLLLAGSAHLQLGEYAPAEDALQKVANLAPGHRGARRLLIETQLRMGQAERALENLQPLLAQSPADPNVLALAGEVHLANNDLARATQYLEKAAKLDGDNAAVRARLGQVHFATGEDQRAIDDLEAASKADKSQYQADLILVMNHLRRNELERASQAMQKLEQKQPDNPLTHNLKGVLLLAKKDDTGARAAFDKALALRPDYYPAMTNLARLDVREGKPEAARERFETALRKEPGNEQLLLGYAQALASTGAGRDQIGRVLEKAVQANGGSASAHLALIRFHAQAGDRQRMKDAAQTALGALPNHPGVMEAAGQVQLASGDVQQAISTFNRLADAQPTSHVPYVRLAGAHMAAKNPDAALHALRKALALKPDFDEAQNDIVKILATSGRHQEALNEARGVQKRRPQVPDGYALEGDVHTAQKKWTEAERAYREALKREPGNSAVFVKLHGTLNEANKVGEAEAMAAQWLKTHPKDMVARSYLAERELAMKNYSSAVAHYKVVAAEQPRNALVLNNLAWASAQQKDPAALDYAQRAYEIAPGNPAVLDTLGVLLVQRGEMGRGLPLLEQAAKLSPNTPDIRFNYARALIKAGKPSAARDTLQPLLKHDNAQVKTEAESLLRTL